MPYLVTVKAGLSNVSLPGGVIAQAGDIVLLTDDQYVQLSPTASGLFSAVSVAAAGSVPTTSVHPWSSTTYNPLVEGDNEPSSTTTPLNTPYTHP